MDRKTESKEDLRALCASVRELVDIKDYQTCESLICGAMGAYPDAPEPHNLLGILLERTGNHPEAMKHFRAAWALDPAYRPAQRNLECYGTFFSDGRCAYDESDCPAEEDLRYYGARGVGRVEERI